MIYCKNVSINGDTDICEGDLDHGIQNLYFALVVISYTKVYDSFQGSVQNEDDLEVKKVANYDKDIQDLSHW